MKPPTDMIQLGPSSHQVLRPDGWKKGLLIYTESKAVHTFVRIPHWLHCDIRLEMW